MTRVVSSALFASPTYTLSNVAEIHYIAVSIQDLPPQNDVLFFFQGGVLLDGLDRVFARHVEEIAVAGKVGDAQRRGAMLTFAKERSWASEGKILFSKFKSVGSLRKEIEPFRNLLAPLIFRFSLFGRFFGPFRLTAFWARFTGLRFLFRLGVLKQKVRRSDGAKARIFPARYSTAQLMKLSKTEPFAILD